MDLSKFTSFFRGLRLQTPSDGTGTGQTKILPGSEQLSTYLNQFSRAVQEGMSNIENQTNSSGQKPVAAPPNISSFTMTHGPSGEIQFQIDDPSEIKRGINYSVDLDTTEHFSNPHTFELGQSRNGHVFLPGQTFYGRATSWYTPGQASEFIYHGGQNKPAPITGGMIQAAPPTTGARAPSQGHSTGGPGTGGNNGPIPARTKTAAYDWTAQKATATPDIQGGLQGQGTPAGQGAASAPSGGTPGGGGLTLTEALIANCEVVVIGGSANAITGTTATPYTALALGFVARIVITATNTNAVTFNLNGTGNKAVTKNGSTALAGGELQNGRAYFVEYDGTRWQIIGPSLPVSALVLASDASGNPAAAVLADTKIWIGQGSGLPAAETVSGDATLADNGALTFATVNGNVGTFGDSTHVSRVTLDGKGRATAAANVAIAFPSVFATVTVPPSTVAALPGSPTTGQIASVNNALAPVAGSAVVGGGATNALVWWNGAQWSVIGV